MWIKALLFSPILLSQPSKAARSIAARRVRAASSPDRYDRSITTFSPEGRLLQLEYALIAAEERGWGLTVCVEWEGTVIFAFPSADSGASLDVSVGEPYQEEEVSDRVPAIKMDHNPLHNTKLHRLSPTHLLLTSGLGGDSRTLASACRRLISSWTHVQFGETISLREVAREVGSIRHGIGLRPGARVLGVVGVLIGLEDVHFQDGVQVEVRMYKSLPGGTIDRCNICCTGGGADSLGRRARKDTMVALSLILSSNIASEDKDTTVPTDDGKRESDKNDKDKRLEEIIEAVGKAALQHHPYTISSDEDCERNTENRKAEKAAVDIWVVQALPSKQTNNDCKDTRNSSASVLHKEKDRYHICPSFISPHRCLGGASLSLRYANSVSLERLPEAVKCLCGRE